MAANYRKTLENILQEDFGIVQAEGLVMKQYLPCVKTNCRSLTVFRPHNEENRIWSMLTTEERNFLKSHYLKLLSLRLEREEKEFIKRTDANMAMTDEDLS